MVRFSLAGKALQAINKCATEEQINKLREEAEVKCPPIENISCKPLEESCLFNIRDDPCEVQNLAKV